MPRLRIAALPFLAAALAGSLHAQDGQAPLFRSEPRTRRVSIRLEVANRGSNLRRAVFVLPLARSDGYQDVRDLEIHGAEICTVPDSDDRFVRFVVDADRAPGPGRQIALSYEFTVTLYRIEADLTRIGRIREYDVDSEECRRHLGRSGVWVDPSEPRIRTAAEELWNASGGYLDYARRCYDYVLARFRYILRYGLKPLGEILDDGGGGCGEISSVYVSLLRAKGVPARHLVGMRPDGSPHVFTEFFLQGYGWIPVDPSAAMGGGDWFGRIRGDVAIVILSRGAEIPVRFDSDFTYPLSLFQTFAHIRWIDPGDPELSIRYAVESKDP